MAVFLAIDASFMDDERWVEMEDRLGSPALAGLFRLYLWAARYKPDGCLGGMGAGAVEHAAQVLHYDGGVKTDLAPGEFFRALVECGFLEELQAGDTTEYVLADFGVGLHVLEKIQKSAANNGQV